ncbi:MAG: head-tail adaptor protein [Actinobacteria bacterium]|nr:head-tail adaptor protein [Actinomycetota bacterium]
MNIGKLNRRLTIVSPGALTDDNIGGFTAAASTSVETWTKKRQLSMKEQLLYGLESGTISFEFTIRYQNGKDLAQHNSLVFEGQALRIISIIHENKTSTKIIADGRTD